MSNSRQRHMQRLNCQPLLKDKIKKLVDELRETHDLDYLTHGDVREALESAGIVVCPFNEDRILELLDAVVGK